LPRQSNSLPIRAPIQSAGSSMSRINNAIGMRQERCQPA
jgi:hypothetical protein